MGASIKQRLFGIGWAIYFKSRWCQNWSKLYRWLYERDSKGCPVVISRTYEGLAEVVSRQLKWIPDGPKELWDVFKSPQYIQRCAFGHNGGKAGDCGAFAMWLATSLNRGVASGKFIDKDVLGGHILSMGWIEHNGKMNAHHVCLISKMSFVDAKRTFAYMDYGMPSVSVNSIREVIDLVLQRFTQGAGATLVAWTITDPATLTPLEVHVE